MGWTGGILCLKFLFFSFGDKLEVGGGNGRLGGGSGGRWGWGGAGWHGGRGMGWGRVSGMGVHRGGWGGGGDLLVLWCTAGGRIFAVFDKQFSLFVFSFPVYYIWISDSKFWKFASLLLPIS